MSAPISSANRPPQPDPRKSWVACVESFDLYVNDESELKSFMQGERFAPWFRKFWNGFYSIYYADTQSKKRTPVLTTNVLSQLEKTEGRGDLRYTGMKPGQMPAFSTWDPVESWAWCVANITKYNREHRDGLFFVQKAHGVDDTYYWRLITNAVGKCIDDRTRKALKVKVITDEYLAEDDRDEMSASEQQKLEQAKEGVTVVWRNSNDPKHGVPKHANTHEDIWEYLFNVTQPFGPSFRYLSAVREAIRTWFQLGRHQRFIAQLYLIERTNDGKLAKRHLTQSHWSNLRSMLPGNRGRVFLLMETTSLDNLGLPEQEEADDPTDLPLTPGLAFCNDTDNFPYTNYIAPTLVLQGRHCAEYDAMENEKPVDAPNSLKWRIDQYDYLIRIARMTKGNLNGDVVKTSKQPARVASSTLEKGNFDHLKEMELLAKSTKESENDRGHLAAVARIGQEVFSEPSKLDRDTFDKYQRWMDNPKLQRENIGEANALLGIADPKVLHIPGMAEGTTLKFWQPVAAAAMYELCFRSSLAFGMLCDSMGLGKTLEILSTIQARLNHRAAVQQPRDRDKQFGVARPILFFVPPVIITQWVDETLRFFPDLNIVVYYASYADKTKHARLRVLPKQYHLTNEDDLFLPTEKNARTIVFTTPMFYIRRHGPSALCKWRMSEGGWPVDDEEGQEDLASLYLTLQLNERTEWQHSLHGCWSFIGIDEAHCAKNGTRIAFGSSLMWQRAATDVPFVFLTGSLFPNGPPDLNYFSITDGGQDFWEQSFLDHLNKEHGLHITPESNPFTWPDEHECVWLRATQPAVNKWIIENPDPVEQGRYVEKLLITCAIKRGHASRVPFKDGPTISDTMPFKQHRVIQLRMTDMEYVAYREFHNAALNRLVKYVKRETSRANPLIFDMYQYRRLCLVSNNTKLGYLTQAVLDNVDHYRQQIDAGLFTLRDLAELICECALEANMPLEFPKYDQQALLDWFSDGSPKTRYFSWILAEVVVKLKEKLVVFTNGPWQQIYVVLWIREFNIPAAFFHAQLSLKARDELTSKFNWDKNAPMVMVPTYGVAGYGVNWQRLARNLCRWDPPGTDDAGAQAVGRIFRIGQNRNCRVWDLVVKETINQWQIANNQQKALVGIFAHLNDEEFRRQCGATDEDDEDDEDDPDGFAARPKGSDWRSTLEVDPQTIADQVDDPRTATAIMIFLKDVRDAYEGGAETQSWSKALKNSRLPVVEMREKA